MAVIITIMAFDVEPPAGFSLAALHNRLPELLVYILSCNCSGLVSPSTHRVEGARIVGNSD
jgi:uncharacterized membrane protein